MFAAIGLLTTGTIGFGNVLVSGLNLVPDPPAIMTAFIHFFLNLDIV